MNLNAFGGSFLGRLSEKLNDYLELL